MPHAQTATFGTSDIGGLNLLGYDLYEDRRADRLSLTLWWQALEAPQTDLKRFVHLYDPETEQVPAQNDAMPRDWTYPTSWWAAGEVVSETLHLDLTDVPAGTYHLGIGWYDPETLERVPVTSPEASSQETRVTLDTPIRRR